MFVRCGHCKHAGTIPAGQVTAYPSYLGWTCPGCLRRHVTPAPGIYRLVAVARGATEVFDDPLTLDDVAEFVAELEACDPSIQLQAETA